MTQPDFLTITHSKDFTIFVSASLDDFNDFRHYFQDVERSRNVNEQELCLVKNQKESVLRVKVPVVENGPVLSGAEVAETTTPSCRFHQLNP